MADLSFYAELLISYVASGPTSPPPSTISTLSSTYSPLPPSVSRTTPSATKILRAQCRRSAPSQYHDPDEAALRDCLLAALHEFELGHPPDRSPLKSLLSSIGISDAASCQAEIEYLEEQILSQEEDTDLLLVDITVTKCFHFAICCKQVNQTMY